MNGLFKITARPIDSSETFIEEQFDAKSDADQYYKMMQQEGESNILTAVPYNAIVIEFQELYNGVWTVASKKLVVQ